jgi:membrane protein DedA with SNARE-associated domain
MTDWARDMVALALLFLVMLFQFTLGYYLGRRSKKRRWSKKP